MQSRIGAGPFFPGSTASIALNLNSTGTQADMPLAVLRNQKFEYSTYSVRVFLELTGESDQPAGVSSEARRGLIAGSSIGA